MAASGLTKLDHFIKASQRFIMVFCSAVIVLIVGISALLRYLFSADLYGAEEFLTIAAFWMYFMGAVYATHTRSHISAEVFSTFCRNATIRRSVYFFQMGVTVALALLYSWWGWKFFFWSLTEGGKSTVWQIPLVVSHAAVSIGFVMMTWYFILQLIGDVADVLRVKIRIAGQYAPAHPATQALDRLKKRIEAESQGKVRMQVYPNSELGDYIQIHEGLSNGTIGMALISVPSQLDRRLEAIYLPGLARDFDEARRLYARGSALFHEADRLHRDLGIKFLGFNMQGFGGIALKSVSDGAVLRDPAAPKRINLRVPPIEIFKLAAKDEGFDPITVPFREVEKTLETDQIDGLAGCPPLAVYLHFRHHIKFFLINRGFLETNSYLMSETLWNSLSPEHQELLQKTIDELSSQSFALAEQVEGEYLEKLRQSGIEVCTLSPAEIDAWLQQARETTWPKLYPHLNTDLVMTLKELVEQSQPNSPANTADEASSPTDQSGRTSE